MVSAIVVAAGRGTRFGPDADKLFLEVAGRPVVAHTWLAWDAGGVVDEIILVVRQGMEREFEVLAGTLPLTRPWRWVTGGVERQDSVWNGLKAVSSDCRWVAVHDGARPCVSVATMRLTLVAAQECGAAVVGHRVTDTLKESNDDRTIERTVDRSRIWAVQTPQVFARDVLCRALEGVRREGVRVTDDTAACERIGQKVRLVESADPNPKVTYPGDLPWVDHCLRWGKEAGEGGGRLGTALAGGRGLS